MAEYDPFPIRHFAWPPLAAFDAVHDAVQDTVQDTVHDAVHDAKPRAAAHGTVRLGRRGRFRLTVRPKKPRVKPCLSHSWFTVNDSALVMRFGVQTMARGPDIPKIEWPAGTPPPPPTAPASPVKPRDPRPMRECVKRRKPLAPVDAPPMVSPHSRPMEVRYRGVNTRRVRERRRFAPGNVRVFRRLGHVVCCLRGCDNKASCRLTRSLRTPFEFADDVAPLMKKGDMGLICNKCYFRDLYIAKKGRGPEV